MLETVSICYFLISILSKSIGDLVSNRQGTKFLQLSLKTEDLELNEEDTSTKHCNWRPL